MRSATCLPSPRSKALRKKRSQSSRLLGALTEDGEHGAEDVEPFPLQAYSSTSSEEDTEEEQSPFLCCANSKVKVGCLTPRRSRSNEGARPVRWPLPQPGSNRTCAQEASERAAEHDSLLEHWRKCSGLHTVQNWCQDFHKHPAGWGALLMIHGVPEVTGRLRSKVDNFAIYAALFLSVSTAVLYGPPSQIVDCSDGGWYCEVRKRVFFISLGVAVISHVLCILLAISFTNALNEAARDSDVIRMFARGRAYYATVKCQQAFLVGVALNFVALSIVTSIYTGVEVVVILCCAIAVAAKIYYSTTAELFSSASITSYWRAETGGKPDVDDPYDLSVPMEILSKKAEDGIELNKQAGTSNEDWATSTSTSNPAELTDNDDHGGSWTVNADHVLQQCKHRHVTSHGMSMAGHRIVKAGLL